MLKPSIKLNIAFGLSIGSSLIAYLAIKRFLTLRKYKHIPGPKSNGVLGFFFGNILDIRNASLEGKSLPDTLYEWSKQYGSVFKFIFLNENVIVISDPDAIKLVTIEKNFPKMKKIYKFFGFPLNERFLGNGIVTETDNEAWRKRRALFNAGFHKTVLLDSLKEFNTKSDLLLAKLRSMADGQTPVTLLIELNKVTLEVISSVSCGLNIDAINDPENKLNTLITNSIAYLDDAITNIFLPLQRKKLNEVKSSFRTIRKFANDVVVERLREIERVGLIKKDILSIVIAKSSAEKMDFEILIDDFLTLFLAGQETTANAIAFSIFEICQNPDVLKKMREEIDRVLGLRREINNDDLVNLEYAGCVFKEALRKYPPIAEMSRKSTEEIVIKGYKIPKNTWILSSQFISHKNPENFPEPDKFIPERFLKDSEFSKKNNITSYTYFPFSLGARNCLGQNFALIEGKVILTKLIQNFDFTLDPSQSLKVKEYITLRLVDGCRVFISPRNV